MRKCKSCGEKYDPRRKLQNSCSVECALDMVKAKADKAKEKKRKAKNKEFKDKVLSTDRGHWLGKAQDAFNAFIRKKDAALGCISCGAMSGIQFHAGHYRSVGAFPELRFDEDNCHKQCATCNNIKSANLIEYRMRLVEKIGEARVIRLESYIPPKHYTIGEIKEIEVYYKAKLKELP